MEYGYIRVSTKSQSIDRQLSSIKKYVLEDKYIFIDKKSGKNFDRKNYLKMLQRLKANDVIYVKYIDRLGRDYDEIINHWNMITKK